MNVSAREIINELREAFPAKRPKPCFPLVGSNLGIEPFRVAEQFEDKDDWTKLAPEWIDEVPDGLASALSFLSDEAICFYVPAFLVADIKGRLEKVDPTFSLCHGFDKESRSKRLNVLGSPPSQTWMDYQTERWKHLSTAQAQAIVHYLEWTVADTSHIFSDQSVKEALAAFWYERANGE